MQKVEKKYEYLRWISLIFTLVIMGVIFFFSSQPGSDSDNVSISLTFLLFSADLGTILNSLVRKFAHLIEYMALGAPAYVFFSTFRKGEIFSCVSSVAFSAVYAVSDEIHQYFVPGRACLVSDMILDSLGAALCIMILHWLIKSDDVNVSKISAEAGRIFLDVCSCHLNGSSLDCDELSEEDAMRVFGIASNQKLLPAVYSTLKEQNKLDSSRECMRAVKKCALAQVAGQTVKSEQFTEVYEKMLNEGAMPVCVKGLICRSLYPHPDQRPSSDEDLLVTEKDFDICSRVIKENGYTLSAEEPGETVFIHPDTGSRIELHSSAFMNKTTVLTRFTEVMGDVFSNPSFIEYNGKKIYCPNVDDHLLYMILHAYKHFISAGVGIRQIMDIAVFVENNDIDYKRLYDKCSAVGAERFAADVLTIADRYFGFDMNTVITAVPEFDVGSDIEPLLNDILDGGVYGGGLDRRHAASVTANDKMSFMKALFPSADQLKKRFPSLKKYPWLLPLIWIKRLAIFFVEGGTSNVLEEAKRRSELVKKYKSAEQ